MNYRMTLAIAALLSAHVICTNSARAEMGQVQVGPGGVYLNVFGGYVNSDGTAAPGHILPSVVAVLVEVEDGGFGGGTLGYVLGAPVLGLSNARVEGSFAAEIFDTDQASDPVSHIVALEPAFVTGARPNRSRQEREVYQGSLAFKGDLASAGAASLTTGMELFLRGSFDKTDTQDLLTGQFREADAESWFYGAMVLVQPEIALTEKVSLVGDLAVGIYGYDGDADFEAMVHDPESASDSMNGVGFRGRASAGIKMSFSPSISATLYAGLDYWSAVPVANMPRSPFESAGVTGLNRNDLMEAKAGLMLTFAAGVEPR